MPSGALLSGLQPQGQAAFWREAHDHPSLPSPLSRWGLFSNCDFISNYCLHTDAASHRKGKYTMSHIITRGPCQGGAELEARGATSSNCALPFCKDSSRFKGTGASKPLSRIPRLPVMTLT